jgi:tetratricopeptide (TPR) repeat protein
MTADRARARAELERLAASADAYGLTAASAEPQARALDHVGNGEAAVALDRAAQRAHPDDFWINSNLAGALVRAGQYDEAARFASVAVAIRPRSVHALVALGQALHLAGRPDDAAATLREALRLRPDDPTALAALDAVLKGPGGPGDGRGSPVEKNPTAR